MAPRVVPKWVDVKPEAVRGIASVITTLAGTLKANELEFNNLFERKKSVVLEFKSDKRMKFGFIEERMARPAERKEWTDTVNTWLNQQKK